MQDVLLNRGADPPHGIGGETEATLRIEALHRLHHADVAFRHQLGQRQAIAAVAHRDLRHQAKMGGHQLVRCLGVAALAPCLGEHVLLVPLQHGELANLLQVAAEIAFRNENRNLCCHVATPRAVADRKKWGRSEEHTSELQSLMRISYAVFCLKKKIKKLTLKSATNKQQHTTYIKYSKYDNLQIKH